MKNSTPYAQLRRQVARRRRDLLRSSVGRDLIYPSSGTAWLPTSREEALCEAFIVLFVAELETYFEAIIDLALSAYYDRFLSSGLQDCAGGEFYIKGIVEQRKAVAKNNNANWRRIKPFFIFIGLTESKFPDGLWDSVESVVGQRGDIAHRSRGLRTLSDPRRTMEDIGAVLRKLSLFDRDFLEWSRRNANEQARQSALELRFVAGSGSVMIEAYA